VSFVDSMESLQVNLEPDVQAVVPELVTLRRRLHQYPELGFKEVETQKLIIEALETWGIERRVMGRTGVVADITGELPGPVLLIRGDMDALPIQEQGDRPYKSVRSGIMHACGHDAHTAMLLTTAKLLKARGVKKGTVRCMFQPAEEGDGGAVEMVKEGVLKNPRVDGALGFHVWSGFDVGRIASLDGPVTASVDGFRIVIEGRGTHAATPEAGVDPVLIAAHFITAAQSLVTRRISPKAPAVLSFTALNAGTAFNIIPEQAEILGTFRTLDVSVRNRLRTDLIRLAESIADSFDATVRYESIAESLPTVNAPKMAALGREIAAEIVGESRLYDFEPPMVGEDFSEILDRVPGVFITLGCQNAAAGAIYPHHHPKFDIDERVLPIGVACALKFADRFLNLSWNDPGKYRS
jgi:amidohydrolase